MRAEKARLVKDKKIKKDKNESIIHRSDDNSYYEQIGQQVTEIELPYEYPDSWEILQLKDICQIIDGEKRGISIKGVVSTHILLETYSKGWPKCPPFTKVSSWLMLHTIEMISL